MSVTAAAPKRPWLDDRTVQQDSVGKLRHSFQGVFYQGSNLDFERQCRCMSCHTRLSCLPLLRTTQNNSMSLIQISTGLPRWWLWPTYQVGNWTVLNECKCLLTWNVFFLDPVYLKLLACLLPFFSFSSFFYKLPLPSFCFPVPAVFLVCPLWTACLRSLFVCLFPKILFCMVWRLKTYPSVLCKSHSLSLCILLSVPSTTTGLTGF